MTVRRQITRELHWSGLPSAAELKDLDAISPGLAAKAIAMVEREQDHAHRLQRRGQWISLLLAMGSITTSAFLVSHGFIAGGLGTAGAWAVGSVGVAASAARASGGTRRRRGGPRGGV